MNISLGQMAEIIKREADNLGLSVAKYIRDACSEKMARDHELDKEISEHSVENSNLAIEPKNMEVETSNEK